VKKAAVVIVGLFLIIAGAWLIVIPESLMRDVAERSIRSNVISLRTDGFKKGLFYSFSARRIVITKRGRGTNSGVSLLELDDVKGWLDLGSVFVFKPRLDFRCTLDDGEVTGDVSLTGKGWTTISGGDIHLKEIPFLKLYGIRGEGIMSGSFVNRNNKGILKISLTKANFSDTTFMGVFLPIGVFHEVRGAATITDGAMEVQSLALSGEGVYGRIKGSMSGGSMNMRLELMTEPSFKMEPLLQAMLVRYKVSPGYYVFPLRGQIPPIK
jgi:type II secretion system protein N